MKDKGKEGRGGRREGKGLIWKLWFNREYIYVAGGNVEWFATTAADSHNPFMVVHIPYVSRQIKHILHNRLWRHPPGEEGGVVR